jgi:hypothetical protein
MDNAWNWPPGDDDEHRGHHREVWDEQAARAEQEAERPGEADRGDVLGPTRRWLQTNGRREPR